MIDTAGAHGQAAGAAVDGPPVGSKLQVEIPGMTFKPVVVVSLISCHILTSACHPCSPRPL